mmetsp:Transcript_48735/g.90409  ORF Transcript_48735/g.90409 Transcript_48735/m.90409 type:complete len:82 (-) Transcript_48735:62-307(-)
MKVLAKAKDQDDFMSEKDGANLVGSFIPDKNVIIISYDEGPLLCWYFQLSKGTCLAKVESCGIGRARIAAPKCALVLAFAK